MHMESKKRPADYMLQIVARKWPWISPDFLDQRAKSLENRKMKNTLLPLMLSRVIKKIQNFQKSENFVLLDDFRVR